MSLTSQDDNPAPLFSGKQGRYTYQWEITLFCSLNYSTDSLLRRRRRPPFRCGFSDARFGAPYAGSWRRLQESIMQVAMGNALGEDFRLEITSLLSGKETQADYRFWHWVFSIWTPAAHIGVASALVAHEPEEPQRKGIRVLNHHFSCDIEELHCANIFK